MIKEYNVFMGGVDIMIKGSNTIIRAKTENWSRNSLKFIQMIMYNAS